MSRTLVIGRSPFADVVVADATIESHHLELVLASDGRLHATDCATASGSWRLIPTPAGVDAAAGEWERIRQAFVSPQTRLRLGDHLCTVADLLAQARLRPALASADGAVAEPAASPGRPAAGHRGRVERNAATGEIVRRRP
jgi:FHA domain.